MGIGQLCQEPARGPSWAPLAVGNAAHTFPRVSCKSRTREATHPLFRSGLGQGDTTRDGSAYHCTRTDVPASVIGLFGIFLHHPHLQFKTLLIILANP